MDHSVLMREMQRPRDADQQFRCLPHRKHSGAQPIRQRTALDIFHRKKRRALVLSHLINLDDVRVMQTRGRLCLRPETRQLVRPVMTGEHLERDEAVQFFLPGAKNHAHAAASEFAFDLVVSKDGTTRFRQRRRRNGSV